ncbi:MAG: Ada metal-binding domain-containing protein, partial [Caulobacteraceae bacterium]
MTLSMAAEMAMPQSRGGASATERDPRWPLVVARDASADGDFFYSVDSTGVYCRPSCPSRAANPKNVRFHDSAAACEAAGFRPCKRCRPDQASPAARNAELAAAACRAIDEAEEAPTLAELANAAGLS